MSKENQSKVYAKHSTKNKKSKSRTSYVISIGLGLVAAWAFISILMIEVKGRKMLKSPEEWSELIKDHPYQRKETDSRAPCPMLNTLANHGFISRDGRNIKSGDLFNALMLMGAPPLVTVGILAQAYTRLKEPNPNDSFFTQFGMMETLDLDRLTVSGFLEHDVSLTRKDLTQEPHSTSRPIAEYVHRMHKIAMHFNKGTESEGMFTRKNEFDTRRIRWLESFADNRFLHLSLFSQFASSTECSLLLDIIGRNGAISLPHLESFLLNESFPMDWRPRTSTYSYTELAVKPLVCWKGLRDSKVTLDLLNQLQ